MSATCEMVTLRGGVTLPAEAVEFAIALEFRGVRMRVDGTTLVVSPSALVTAEDADMIRRHRTALVEVVRYCDRPEFRQ